MNIKGIYIIFLSTFMFSISVRGYVGQSDVCRKHSNYSNDEIVALILARGGSKGIHLKNLAQIGSDTLLSRTLKTIFNSKVFADVWVSTDSDLIASEAIKFNANVHIRAKHSADDSTTSIASVQEFLNIHSEINNVALVQCTSAFLTVRYLQEAVQLFQTTQVDCVFAVTRSFKLRWNYDAGKLVPLNFNLLHRPRRQDWNGELVETGMIYVTKKSLLQNGAFQNERCGFIEVCPSDELEIDSPSDLQLANVLIKLRKNYAAV
ncbi:N-acylneuraminate cytidylyltransferase [Bradysia coprophila]|uniref:N-acylneuraminate cytidylyltransferase n=1 Tax=Bradysia coprophila TaxID=38358 RepID=UPI00187D728F|nr:N-acylneuraminate cytidylyltransferase [Bradysia coprophila]